MVAKMDGAEEIGGTDSANEGTNNDGASLGQTTELLTAELIAASQPFVGQWNRLVSTTNWDKGRIINDWRQALVAQDAAVTEYSDEAWGRLVGGVTGQHVGRLRRVFQRFGGSQHQYAGLFWSHFQAALDWNDAEMWLEGAVQQDWSVSKMREQRWETMGALEADKPRQEDVIASEKDEDFEPAKNQKPDLAAKYEDVNGDVPGGPRHEGSDFGEESGSSTGNSFADRDYAAGKTETEPLDLVRPFANLPTLPDDLAEAVDQLKLAILHHKTAGWRDATVADVVQTLEALKMLCTAPSPSSAPF